VNCVDQETGDTALHICAFYNHVEVGQELINAGAKVNLGNLRRQTPLHVACEQNSHRFVHMLVTLPGCPVDLNAVDLKELTPMHVASHLQSGECWGLLMQHGARVDIPDSQGRVILHDVCQFGRLKGLKILLTKAKIDVNVQSLSGLAYFGYFVALTPSARCAGNTGLHVGAINNHKDIVQSLLEAGADPTLKCASVGLGCNLLSSSLGTRPSRPRTI
jgi:ankyrin repeat protein